MGRGIKAGQWVGKELPSASSPPRYLACLSELSQMSSVVALASHAIFQQTAFLIILIVL